MAISVVGRFSKDPDDTADFGIDWHKIGVLDEADAIASSSWDASEPSGLTIESSPPPTLHDDSITAVWLSGGTPGTKYVIANTIITDGGRTFQRSLQITVREL
jgi:hypothetical protein